MKRIEENDVFNLYIHFNSKSFETFFFFLMSINCVACCFLLDSQELSRTLRFPGTHKNSFFCAEEGIFNVS